MAEPREPVEYELQELFHATRMNVRIVMRDGRIIEPPPARRAREERRGNPQPQRDQQYAYLLTSTHAYSCSDSGITNLVVSGEDKGQIIKGWAFRRIVPEGGQQAGVKEIHVDDNPTKVVIKKLRTHWLRNHPRENINSEIAMARHFGDVQHVMPLFENQALIDDKYKYLVMPNRGHDLLQTYKAPRDADNPVPDAVSLTRMVVKSLKHLQDNHVIHRDISPENIIYDGERNCCLVIDGAMSLQCANETDANGQVVQHPVVPQRWPVGKPPYMAPEVELGQILDPRVDVFSAGLSLFTALSGMLLYNKVFARGPNGELHTSFNLPGTFFFLENNLQNNSVADRQNMIDGLAGNPDLAEEEQDLLHRLRVLDAYSDDRLDLFKRMVHQDRNERITAQHASEHPFLAVNQ